MGLMLSCAFATDLDTHEHVRIAESLGYQRAWLYDSPALYPDVWVQLCRAAERTERIGLGPGVLVPSNRHPLITASAIATLVDIAGAERVVIGVGSGFTARMALGQRALPWAGVRRYVLAVRALLRGESVDWDGAQIEMLHTARCAPPRPIEVPFVIAAAGPKGIAAARDIGDGVFGAPMPIGDFDWSVVLAFGTVLRSDEAPGSDRSVAAAGHAAATMFHFGTEHGLLEQLMPGDLAGQWTAAYQAVPEDRRHLEMHRGHLVEVNEVDAPFVSGSLLAGTGLALDREGWRAKLAELEQGGATEVAYQPAGPDIPGELEAFASVFGA
ncbi:MAG TPA: LLM class flavin-dependent oxidoreductase [Solirubrobacteraceae bacterium]|jgi:5,10-methylenetetrahydromethanopterin reductase|nr:LLM class flavin-dependent oxidoreductase [Solirubrobacteraceae bacterium]